MRLQTLIGSPHGLVDGSGPYVESNLSNGHAIFQSYPVDASIWPAPASLVFWWSRRWLMEAAVYSRVQAWRGRTNQGSWRIV